MNKDKTLRTDQFEDLVKLMANDRYLLLNDAGCGKSPTVCVYMHWLWFEKKERTVFVMPKTLRKKNKQELHEWTEFTDDDVLIYDGGPITTDPKVFVLTFDRWRMSWRKLLQQFPDINAVIVDEIQLGYKSNGSKRTQELYWAMEKIDRFVAMTGTLIAGRLDSAFPCIMLVEPRYYASHEHFMATHAVTDEYGRVLVWTNHEKLCKILLAHGTSRSFEEVHGKENKTLQVETVDMSPKQRAKYSEFEENALLELDDRFLDGSLPGVNAIRCRQIMAHPEDIKLPIDYDAKGKPIAWKTYNLTDGEMTGKDERLEVHLDELLRTKQQFAIFGTFVTEIERVAARCRKLGLRIGVIHGGISEKVRNQVDDDFREGRLDGVIATCATAGVGLNWPDLNRMIFMSMDYQDDRFFQAYRRAMRGKREHPLRITVLEYADSIDQTIMAIVERKSRDAAKVDKARKAISFREAEEPCDIVSEPKPGNSKKANKTAGFLASVAKRRR